MPVSAMSSGTILACVHRSNRVCLSRVVLPVEYKMVRIGNDTANYLGGNMFNMTAMSDDGDLITSTYRMSDRWDNRKLLRFRHITMRLYRSPSSGEHLLCAVYNTYGHPHDGLGVMSVNVTVKGLDGQALRWVACDDRYECQGEASETLCASHKTSFPHSDGWCIAPIEADGRAVSVKFTNVNRFEGVSFQFSDAEEDEHLFIEGKENGFKGEVDFNGVVTDGEVPEITFNLSGMEVPQ